MSGMFCGPARRIQFLRSLLLLLGVLLPLSALAAEPEAPSEEKRTSPSEPKAPPHSEIPPPPDFLRNKNPLPEIEWRDKKPDWYFTGIPLVGVDPDSGFNYGASIQWFQDGPKDSPFFYYASYRQKVAVNFLQTTGGTREYTFEYDHPYIADSPWSLWAFGGYLENRFENYFGVGEQTLDRLSFPGTPGQTYGKADDYFRALREDRNGKTWERYNFYDKRQPILMVNLTRDYLGGLLRPLVGFQVSHVSAIDYSGVELHGNINQESKLREDHRLGRIREFKGGWLNLLRLALMYDTRDYAPDPSSGVLGQAQFEGTTRFLGASSDFGHVTLSGQGYLPLLRSLTRLVLATNVIYSAHFGVTPFYAYPSMSLPTNERLEGLGGWGTIRGYHQNRFVGKAQMQATAEIRWTMGDFTFLKQNLKPMLATFVDTGRVFDKIAKFSTDQWKTTYGFGFRLAWNVATIISFDYSFGSEGNLFYMELGYPF